MLQYASPISESRSSPPTLGANSAPAFAEIDTPRAKLRLVRAGMQGHWPNCYQYSGCGDGDSDVEAWLWEATGLQSAHLGFIGLVPARSARNPNPIFGPMLTVMLKQDIAPGLGTEIISGLMAWLDRKHICHIVHARHGRDDIILAHWLDAAGFLYTGCQDLNGDRSMILVL